MNGDFNEYVKNICKKCESEYQKKYQAKYRKTRKTSNNPRTPKEVDSRDMFNLTMKLMKPMSGAPSQLNYDKVY